MFREWGFLLGEIWVLLLLAALLGLFVGWLIWGRGSSNEGDLRLRNELDACRKDLEKCRALHSEKDAKISVLRAASTAVPIAEAVAKDEADYDGDGVVEGADEGTKPMTLSAPRDGGPDDLKRIKGVGPKMEDLLHRLGFYHFDQVANWSHAEVAWVDANLEGFKGRVSRDNWVSQAKLLASGAETEFSKKVDKGDVY